MTKFVCVRVVQANDMDLALFQFDNDLTFNVIFLNSDRTIYGRYGSRSDFKDAIRHISMAGLKGAMAAALELHKKYPANKATLKGKSGPLPRFSKPEGYPDLQRYKPKLDYNGKVAKSCMHCHMIVTAERKMIRNAKKPIPDSILFPYPIPDVLGLSFDPQQKTTLRAVLKDSAAEQAGLKKGDEILTLDGQPLISIADVQWVLQQAKAPTELNLEYRRNQKTTQTKLKLAQDWRKSSNISWRETSWDLRRMTLGGMRLEPLKDKERKVLGLAPNSMALRVKHLGQWGAHAAAKKAGARKGDVIIQFGDQSGRINESELLAYLLTHKMKGERVPITVYRGKKKMTFQIPMQ